MTKRNMILLKRVPKAIPKYKEVEKIIYFELKL